MKNHFYRKSAKRTGSTKKNPQAYILAGLNVFAVLENQAPQYLHAVLWYGPRSFAARDWAAVLIWYRKKGYHNYQALTLFGIWARADLGRTGLCIGHKTLQYQAAIYNPESYHQLIKRGFTTYYADAGTPPDEDGILFQTLYEPTRRLALRRELASAMRDCLRQLMAYNPKSSRKPPPSSPSS